jgi:hypothetical protein
MGTKTFAVCSLVVSTCSSSSSRSNNNIKRQKSRSDRLRNQGRVKSPEQLKEETKRLYVRFGILFGTLNSFLLLSTR